MTPELRTRFAWYPRRVWGLRPCPIAGTTYPTPLWRWVWLKPVVEMRCFPLGVTIFGDGVWTVYERHQPGYEAQS